MIPISIALAGGFGATSRFIADGLIRTLLRRKFPWGTLVINIVGSFILGLVVGLTLYRQVSPDLKLIVGTGFCGGFTTFSTASFETVRLIEERRYAATLFLAIGNLGFSFLAAACGLWLIHH
jgi:CrcB protein